MQVHPPAPSMVFSQTLALVKYPLWVTSTAMSPTHARSGSMPTNLITPNPNACRTIAPL